MLIQKQQGNIYHKQLLQEFWDNFNGRKNNGSKYKKDLKLKVLKEFAEKKVLYKNQQNLKKRRKAFISKFGGKYCFLCGTKPQCRHHIIQLQNGGINARKNIVQLCHPCHAEIHPWLKAI